MAHWAELLNFDSSSDYAALKQLVGQSVQVKEDIAKTGSFEHGIRKALNLGHTVGHAFEYGALAENRPVLHEYAGSLGNCVRTVSFSSQSRFPERKMRQTISLSRIIISIFTFDCKNMTNCMHL